MEPDEEKRKAKYFPEIGEGARECADEDAEDDGPIFMDYDEQDMAD